MTTTAGDPLVWSEIRDRLVGDFGDQLPRSTDEAEIIRVFEERPHVVLRAAAEIAEQFLAGAVRWPWSVLAKRLADSASAPREVVVEGSRRKLIAAAERWLRNTGCYCESEVAVVSEMFEESFGEFTGLARVRFVLDAGGKPTGEWRVVDGDQRLVERMVDRWRVERPRGVAAEAASAAYFERLAELDRAASERSQPQPEQEEEPQAESEPQSREGAGVAS